jgi:hypothetical protein
MPSAIKQRFAFLEKTNQNGCLQTGHALHVECSFKETMHSL